MAWGPWIYYDGAGPKGVIPQDRRLLLRFDGGGIKPVNGAAIPLSWPGLYWRMKPAPGWRWPWQPVRYVRVCDDPAYAPIVAYRLHKPRGMEILEEILADLPEEVDA
jgi:hypothetical protein